MADFFANLDRINAMAERMPGFVWRLKDESGNATAIPWPGDPTMNVNMSVWESVGSAGEIRLPDGAHENLCAQARVFRDARDADSCDVVGSRSAIFQQLRKRKNGSII